MLFWCRILVLYSVLKQEQEARGREERVQGREERGERGDGGVERLVGKGGN